MSLATTLALCSNAISMSSSLFSLSFALSLSHHHLADSITPLPTNRLTNANYGRRGTEKSSVGSAQFRARERENVPDAVPPTHNSRKKEKESQPDTHKV